MTFRRLAYAAGASGLLTGISLLCGQIAHWIGLWAAIPAAMLMMPVLALYRQFEPKD